MYWIHGVRINDSLICDLYQVLPRGRYYVAIVVLERENEEFDISTYQIQEVLVIGCLEKGQYVHFGTMDGSNWVVVAVEELGKEGADRVISDESIRIYRAWIYDEFLWSFRELPLRGLYRINDGYYY